MWGVGMYELMANERIATYQREAARDRLGRDAAAERRGTARRAARPAGGSSGAAPDPAMRSARLGFVAALVGVAAARALRRR